MKGLLHCPGFAPAQAKGEMGGCWAEAAKETANGEGQLKKKSKKKMCSDTSFYA